MPSAVPSVSVVIPAHNSAPTIARAVLSVCNQSHKVHEIIVVDDGSSDGTREVVDRLKKPATVLSQSNLGAAAARNAGIRSASGDWISFLDADDVWYSDRLEQQFRLQERYPTLQWLGGSFNIVNDRISESVTRPRSYSNIAKVHSDAIRLISEGVGLWTGAMLIRREVFDLVGGFDTTQRTGEDLEMWIRIAKVFPEIGYVHFPIASYSIGRSDSLTATAVSLHDKSQLECLRKLLLHESDLDMSRRTYLKVVIENSAGEMVLNAIRHGDIDYARWLKQELSEMGLVLPRHVRALTFIPSRLIKLMRSGYHSIVRKR